MKARADAPRPTSVCGAFGIAASPGFQVDEYAF
jgi:hypothetical protein